MHEKCKYNKNIAKCCLNIVWLVNPGQRLACRIVQLKANTKSSNFSLSKLRHKADLYHVPPLILCDVLSGGRRENNGFITAVFPPEWLYDIVFPLHTWGFVCLTALLLHFSWGLFSPKCLLNIHEGDKKERTSLAPPRWLRLQDSAGSARPRGWGIIRGGSLGAVALC